MKVVQMVFFFEMIYVGIVPSEGINGLKVWINTHTHACMHMYPPLTHTIHTYRAHLLPPSSIKVLYTFSML